MMAALRRSGSSRSSAATRCHRPAVGSSAARRWTGSSGSAVKLTGRRRTVTADDDYLRESILQSAGEGRGRLQPSCRPSRASSTEEQVHAARSPTSSRSAGSETGRTRPRCRPSNEPLRIPANATTVCSRRDELPQRGLRRQVVAADDGPQADRASCTWSRSRSSSSSAGVFAVLVRLELMTPAGRPRAAGDLQQAVHDARHRR